MRASELRVVAARCAAAATCWLAVAAAALAQTPLKSAGGIYSCTTADGRRLTSDRPIAECSAREQRVLNADGSLRTVVPPSMSPEERAAQEANERKLAAERAARADAARRDRNLMTRYRNEAQHQKARESALDDVVKSMQISEKRVQDLAAERKPLLDEAEFYKGRQFPAKLKLQLDANDASTQAQKELIENQKAELVRVNKLYDAELARLRKLWAGAAPGSVD
ncbi:hypothetical protein PFX98_05985 [Paucibacter sediminis]|uniref:DUF4124 domain-containing protein n=1 Tax=Paucibacter sediminis TaxID=3019553 RepID=A0AA95NHG5_9BURK|nr:hypothetical protein [Paucibacter sp. S2-9]WIT13157.1 hypothetical protein PFX98_05985 [Paucibacter sp. S2-9]